MGERVFLYCWYCYAVVQAYMPMRRAMPVAHIHACYESRTGKRMKSLRQACHPPLQAVRTVSTNFTINTQECNMEIPEYLLLFSGEGDFVVEPRFKGGHGMVTRRRMAAIDVNQLITPDQTGFYREMYFDDHLLHIMRYVIDPQKRIMTIWAKT